MKREAILSAFPWCSLWSSSRLLLQALVLHHGQREPCGSRLSSRRSRSCSRALRRTCMHDPPACGHALLQFIPRLCGSTQRYSPHVLFAGDMWKARSPTHVDIHRVTVLTYPLYIKKSCQQGMDGGSRRLPQICTETRLLLSAAVGRGSQHRGQWPGLSYFKCTVAVSLRWDLHVPRGCMAGLMSASNMGMSGCSHGVAPGYGL